MSEERSCFKRERRYLVLKLEDIDNYIAPYGQKHLREICEIITSQRLEHGKKEHGYVVVADDEPYIEQVWKLIKENWKPRLSEVEKT